MRKHPLAQMLVIGTIASILGVILALAIDWFPPQGSASARDIDTLYDVLMIVSVPIFVLVMTVAIYSVVKFRARPGDQSDGAPIHGNTKLEVVWVTIPFLIVSALAFYGWVVLDDIERPQPNTMVVDVTGQQFAWSFEYPQPGGAEPVQSNELVLPVNRPVDFNIQALDVIHSFWVPAFRLKSDAVPGIETTYRVTPDVEGTYDVVCAELCGLGHATMRQSVRVVPEEEFTSWLAQRKEEAAPAAGAAQGTGPDEGAAPSGEDQQAPPSDQPEAGTEGASSGGSEPVG